MPPPGRGVPAVAAVAAAAPLTARVPAGRRPCVRSCVFGGEKGDAQCAHACVGG